jgi:putative tryptophan/tyrosine transport system substrate-binding protein
MGRRVFLGGSLGFVAAPTIAEAQLVGKKLYRVGTLSTTGRDRVWHVIRALQDSLRDLGYIEGQNVVFEHRFADGHIERLPSLLAELVQMKVEVIVVGPNTSVLAAKRSGVTIPIVMTFGTQPVSSGIADSLAHPGGSVTGLIADVTPETWGARLQLLREVEPRISRVAVLWNPDVPGLFDSWQATAEAAKRLGLSVRSREVRRPEDLDSTFSEITKEAADALVVIADGLTFARRREIIEFAAKRRLPAIYGFREAPDDGGLMSYGVNLTASYRSAATFVHKILNGAKPGDLPMEQPTKLELVINLKTAKALNLVIPPAVLLRADEMIQ